MACHNGLLYLVHLESLIEIDSAGARTAIGTIDGSGRCCMVSDGVNLIIRTGAKTYIYNTSLSLVTDSDLENAKTASILNNQIIYQGTGARFGVADAGNPTSIDGLFYATAETYPDDLVQVYSWNERVYMGGEQSIEVWYNSGTGSPPFDKVQQSTADVGVASPYSMVNSEDYLYFLGHDNVVYRMSTYQPQSVTPSAICKEIRESETSDAQGYMVKIDGQSFYILQLPTTGLTLAYSESTGEWIKLMSGTSGRHLINGYCYIYGKNLICDYANGNVYEWDTETYTSNGSVIIRQRDSAPINGIALGAIGRRLLMGRAELIMETGVGNTDEPDPEVMFSCSIDGGRSFTNEDWVKIGREGESVKRVEWYNMKSAYDFVIRVKVSDPCFIGIHSASIDIRDAGW
jgi:hypothetical protein